MPQMLPEEVNHVVRTNIAISTNSKIAEQDRLDMPKPALVDVCMVGLGLGFDHAALV